MTIHDDLTTEGRPIPNEPDLQPDPPALDHEPAVDVEPPAHMNGHGSNGHRPKPARDAEQLLPHDLDVERNLLGAALLGQHQALDQVPDTAFYAPAHGHIANAIRTLAAGGASIDTVIVADHLRTQGLLDNIGGPVVLAQIMGGCPSSTAAPTYAGIINRHHRARQLIQGAEELARTVRTHGPDAAHGLIQPLLDHTTATAGHTRLYDGSWILDAPTNPPAIWGHDSEVLWAAGEPLLITGPPGVGKTTLTGQLVRARLGATPDPHVLGWPVEPDTRGKVLYLASDRPQQIRRALARCFTEHDRPLLDERLTIWSGPPPSDLAKDTSTLTRLAQQAGATTVILDSLKDMAIGLSDDEVGAGLNQAMQLALADGIDVLALHHQRKGTDGKRPKTLEDLYGSTWIAAGAGSILLLWGAAGDLIVELHHLKQPSSDIGPLKIEHDHYHGTSAVHRGFDLHAALRHAPHGLTTLDVTRLWLEKDKPTEPERRKAQRRLDNAVRLGQATRVDGSGRMPDGTLPPARYYAVDTHHQEQF